MRIKKIIITTIILLVLLLAGGVSFLLYETKDEIKADFASIDKHLLSFYNKKRTAGFAVAVFDADTVYFKKGYGFADVDSQKPYTTSTQQYVASISKTLIGISLVKAAELGILELDAPINNYLSFEVTNPNFKETDITLRQLATHASSLDYNEAVVESLYVTDSLKDASLTPIMKDYFEHKKYGKVSFGNYMPGNRFNYSNIGASLAAYIIEKQSGLTFNEFTKKYIFEPLDLGSSTWFESETDPANFTSYYESTGKDEIKEVSTEGVKMYPSRDLITNIDDLTTFCQAILKKDEVLLAKSSFDNLLEVQLDGKVQNEVIDNSGLFFMIDRNQYGVPYSLTGMNGGDNCINTMMWFDQKTGLGYIFLGNTGQSEFNRINHIWLFRSLVSLGDHIAFKSDQGSFSNRWHNWSSRIRGVF
ncbi:serine hydrolase domain-containing protein [uncultured Croceitalea sp.]|uniref:serine hydrolase domain-containing protein n=1 Tax=uncultured Croceitalea sp. TaxID=1798908 RepID=UPI0033066507